MNDGMTESWYLAYFDDVAFVRSFVRKEYKDFKIEYSIYAIFFTYYVIDTKWRRCSSAIGSRRI